MIMVRFWPRQRLVKIGGVTFSPLHSVKRPGSSQLSTGVKVVEIISHCPARISSFYLPESKNEMATGPMKFSD